MADMDYELIEKYKEFKTADHNVSIKHHIECMGNPRLQQATKDVLKALDGSPVIELKIIAKTLDSIADEYVLQEELKLLENTDNYGQLARELGEILDDLVRRELVKRGYASTDGTNGGSNSTKSGTPKSTFRLFLEKIFN